MKTSRRWCLLLLILVCSAVFTYLHTYVSLTAVTTSSITLQLREHGVVNVHSAGNFLARVAEFSTFLTSLRVKELTRRGKDA